MMICWNLMMTSEMMDSDALDCDFINFYYDLKTEFS